MQDSNLHKTPTCRQDSNLQLGLEPARTSTCSHTNLQLVAFALLFSLYTGEGHGGLKDSLMFLLAIPISPRTKTTTGRHGYLSESSIIIYYGWLSSEYCNGISPVQVGVLWKFESWLKLWKNTFKLPFLGELADEQLHQTGVNYNYSTFFNQMSFNNARLA